jgi:RNA polymerase sigma factor (sigma-70 family)
MSDGPDPSDDELLERWRAGDDRAGHRLLERHFVGLRAFLLARVEDEELVKDMVQDTMLVVLKARDQFRGESKFRTYLYGIARNKVREQMRKLAKDRERFDPASESLADLTGRRQSAILSDKDEVRRLFDALRLIPVETAELLELYYFQDLSVAELAELEGAKANTIKSRLRLARAKLASVYAELAGAAVERDVDDEAIEALMRLGRGPARRGELHDATDDTGDR